VIYAAENSNKFQKTRFWKEKSVEDEFTLGPTALASLAIVEEMYGDTNNFIHELSHQNANLSFKQLNGITNWDLFPSNG
jgi:hypothetical protein